LKYSIRFNNNLGVFPVSLFIEVEEKIKIFEVWDKIQEYNCIDIIFYGNLKDNVQEFNFLSSRLISNMYHVSAILSDYALLKDITSSRIIIFFDSNTSNSTNFKNRVAVFKYLSNRDIIILNPSSFKELMFTRQYFINNEIKANIMVKCPSPSLTTGFNMDTLIENKIFDIRIYEGEVYV